MSHTLRMSMVAAFAVTLSAGSVLAVQDEDLDLDTTEDLYQICSVAPGNAEFIPASFACRGFIEGAVQYHDAVSDRRNLKRLICYPENATVADGRAVFVAWAEKNAGNQEFMDEMPVVGLVRALAERFPCRP